MATKKDPFDPTPAADYEPSESDKRLIGAIEDKYTRWSDTRRAHEAQWYLNTAFYRGNHYVFWHTTDQRLHTPPAPSHRVRLPINRVMAKVRARHAKFLKNRPVPLVIPATSDLKDRLDARATTKALDYIWRKIRLEAKYRDALVWSSMTGHGYWWFHWDPSIMGRVQIEDPELQTKTILDAPLGDVVVEVGSPFELLVGDPGASSLADQPEIMRIKLRPVEEVRARFPEKGKFVAAETAADPALRYEHQIAGLTSSTAFANVTTPQDQRQTDRGTPTHVVVKEWFEKPTPPYPKGRYVVVANGVLLKMQEELPYGFSDMANPYPVVDFVDILQAGQYWCTTILEQLIPLQREYNLIRSKIAEQLRIMAFPKLLVAKQHQIAPGTWTSESGEVVEYVALPGIKEPTPWHPPNIAADAWRNVELLKTEFDDISHIFPEAEGRVGQATSGFQTNLLQEATDQTHAPDIRAHEMTIEEAAFKLRRLMKRGYEVPRLITVAGRDLQPEAFEFSSEDIDEHADIIVQAGSGLPQLKGARIQSIMELYNIGLLGDQNNPEVKRRAMSMLELTTLDDAYDYARRDEDQARIENDKLVEGSLQHQPDAWENHDIHYRVHTDLLKSPESESWPDEKRLGAIAHVIQHVKFQNPQSAIDLAIRYGIPEVVQDLIQQQMMMQQAPMQTGPAPALEGAPPTEGAPTPEASLSGATQALPEGGFGAQGGETMMPPGV